MKWSKYVKEHFIDIFVLLFLVLFFFFSLLLFHLPWESILFLLSFLILGFVFCFVYHYLRKKKFYHNFFTLLNDMDQKYLITEIAPEATFLEAELLLEALYDVDKACKERINDEVKTFQNLKDYIELWIHEIKLPIASLILRNHNKNIEDKKELEQIRRIENCVEQVLFYVRSEHASEDYYVHACGIKDIVKQIMLRNKDDLLNYGIEVETHHLDYQVYTDGKWLEFILNQIVSNAIRYRKNQDAHILIEAREEDNKVYLDILDNGIGIKKEDLPKVFDKSFTGNNGHNYRSSTGMGLYLCKKMCNLLGHKIEIVSEEQKYTKVTLIFGKDSTYDVLK